MPSGWPPPWSEIAAATTRASPGNAYKVVRGLLRGLPGRTRECGQIIPYAWRKPVRSAGPDARRTALCADARKLHVTLRDGPPLTVHLGRRTSTDCRVSMQAQPSPRAVAPGPVRGMTGRRREVSRRDDGYMNPVPPSCVPLQSAVLVPVPEAELAAGRHRRRFDRAAIWGVPAHVTVRFPFAAPSAITGATITALADAAGSVTAFDCEFPAAAWSGQEVVWLAPQPAGPFRALTRAVPGGLS